VIGLPLVTSFLAISLMLPYKILALERPPASQVDAPLANFYRPLDVSRLTFATDRKWPNSGVRSSRRNGRLAPACRHFAAVG